MTKKKIILISAGIGIFLILMIILPISILFYLETDHAQDLIQSEINKAIPGTISYEGFRFSLLNGKIELRDALLKAPSDEKLAGFDHFFADVSWLTLFRGDLTVESLVLEKPWARLRKDSQGNLSLMEAFPRPKETEQPEKKGELPFNIVVRSLRLDQGAVTYMAETEETDAAIENLNLAADGNPAKQQGNLFLEIGKGHIDSPKIRSDLDQLQLRASLRDGRIDSFIFKFGTRAAKLTLTGNAEDVFKDPALNLTLDLGAALAAVRESLNLEQNLSGDLSARLTMQGTLNNPDATLHLDYGGGNLFGSQVDKVLLDCQLSDRQVIISELGANAASGLFRVQGDIDLKAAFAEGFLASQKDLEAIAYQLSLVGDQINLRELLVDDPNMRGIVSADISVQGKGISPETLSAEVALELLAKQLNTGQTAAPVDLNLKAAATLDQGIADIRQLEAKAGDIRLETTGRFDLHSQDMTANLTLNAPNLEKNLLPLGVKDVSGGLRLRADVSGSARQPVFDLDLKGERLRFQDITIGNATIDAALGQSGMLRISKLSIDNQGSVLEGGGTVQVFRDALEVNPNFPSDLSLALRDVRPKVFLAKPVSDGIINGDIRVSGNLKAPKLKAVLKAKELAFGDIRLANIDLDADLSGDLKKPKGTLSLEAKGISLGAQKLKEIQLLCEPDGKKIGITTLRVAVTPKETIEGSGWIVPSTSAYQMELASKGILLQHIDKVRNQKIAKGSIGFKLSGQGKFDDPQVSGTIGIRNLRLKGKPVDDFQVNVDLQDHLARVSGRLNFDLDASYHLQKKDFAASVLLNETDLSPYFKIADQTDLGGVLTGKIEAVGNADAADKIQANANLSKLDFSFRGKPLVRSKNFKAQFRNGEISVSDAVIQLLQKGQLRINGRGKPQGPFDFQVKGDIPLEVAGLFTDEVPDIRGQLNLDASLRGMPDKPDIQADIRLKDAGLTVPGLFQELHGVNAQIQVTPEMVTIQDFKGQLDTGRFELGGKARLKAFKPVDIDVRLNANVLPLEVPDTLDMLLNADLRLHGTSEKTALEGDAVILEGTYYKDVNLSLFQGLQGIVKKKRETVPAAKSSDSSQPFLRNMDLDISVKRRNPFMVDNNLAILDVNPDLRIYGTLNRPLVSGRAGIDSGTITYQKKEFEVQKGVIDFLNPYKIEPTIDVESEVAVRDWTISLKIAGTPDQLRFELTSDPPEEHGDILSLLLLGRTTRESTKKGGGGSLVSAQMVTEILEETFGEDIKKAAGLDILEVKFDEDGQDTGDSNGVTVTMGKELSRRMTVKYEMESKSGETRQRAIAEYRLLENLLVNAFQDVKGSFGGEVLFRLEFR